MLRDRSKTPPVETGGTKKGGAKEELETLYQMAKRWYISDTKGADMDGTEQFILDDYREKLQDWMMPYVRRMVETKAITQEECGEFTSKLWQLCEYMRILLHLPEKGKNVIPLDQRRVSVP